ncbi:alanine racemase C-terminal domain-containing protein [Brevibacillus laterosporus]|uniref:alanine racemase C-terminal domain-containing protein n=1 Tax=Brevibacillus laterosporus TaxID=1465 RepID=UPI003D249E5D
MENVRKGDIAVIIGKSGEAEITACEIAEHTGKISNEILSRLGGRFEKYIIHPTTLQVNFHKWYPC